MKLKLANECRAHSQHCSQQAHLSMDAELRKYWDDLAAEWLVLEAVQTYLPAKAK